MAAFSLILPDPQIRQIVQEGALEKSAHDALFPLLLYRGEAIIKEYPGNVGDTPVFTARGLFKKNLLPFKPGSALKPVSHGWEQWSTVIQKWVFGTTDTDMPTSIVAIIDLFLDNCHTLGLQAGESLNDIARNYLYNAAMSGNTVATALVNNAASVHVARINGFTTARRPDLSGGSPVAFQPVSSANPLAITVYNGAVAQAVNVTAVVPDNPGDQYGPGTLTLDGNVSCAARNAVIATDASQLVYAGAPTGLSIDAIASQLTLALQRQAVAQMRSNSVPTHPDGRYHCHLDPTAEGELFGDPEQQRLLTALPDYYMYREFTAGELQGSIFFRNQKAPQPGTVNGGPTNAYDPTDWFGGELWQNNATVNQVHHTLFTGQGGLYEYWINQQALMTAAGVAGRTADFKIVNNGIEVYADRSKLVLREALNREGDQVSATSLFFGGWAVRTDLLASSGGAARYKRFVDVMHL